MKKSMMVVGILLGAVLSLVGCGDEEDATGLPHNIDCSACDVAEVCWFTLGYESNVERVGCLKLPAECPEPADCDCVNTVDEQVCDQVGWVQNGGACTTHRGVAVVECISTLG